MAISALISHSPHRTSLSTWTRWGFAACFEIWTRHSLGEKIKHFKVNPTQAGRLQHTDFPCLRSSTRPRQPGSRTQCSWLSSQLPFAVYPVKPRSESMNPSSWDGMWDGGTRASLGLFHTWLYQGSFDCKRDRLTARAWLFSPINSSPCLYLERQFKIKSSPFPPGSSRTAKCDY